MIAHGRLVAFDTPEDLEKHLLSPSEVVLTTDAGAEEVWELLEDVEHITQLTQEPVGNNRVTVHLKTDLPDVYDLSRAVFSVFAAAGKPLLELTVKKANLEDILLELAETGDSASQLPAVEAELVESEADPE